MSGVAVYLNELGIDCALGSGQQQVVEALFAGDRPAGVRVTDAFTPGRALALGAVDGAEGEWGCAEARSPEEETSGIVGIL